MLSKLFGGDDEEDESDEDEEGGCGAHHFMDYEETKEYRAEARRERRHNNGNYRYCGEWLPSTHSVFDLYKLRENAEKRVAVVVERKEKAVCDHEGCNAVDYRWSEEEHMKVKDGWR